jgi:hypothetical protein
MPSQDVRQRRLVFTRERTIEDRLALDEICGRAARIGAGLASAALRAVVTATFLTVIEYGADDIGEPGKIRFRHEARGAVRPGNLGRSRIGIAGDEDERGTGTLRLSDGERRQPIESRYLRVGKDDIRRASECLSEGDLTLHPFRRAGETRLLQHPAGRLRRGRIILENQHPDHFSPIAARP